MGPSGLFLVLCKNSTIRQCSRHLKGYQVLFCLEGQNSLVLEKNGSFLFCAQVIGAGALASVVLETYREGARKRVPLASVESLSSWKTHNISCAKLEIFPLAFLLKLPSNEATC